MPPFKSRRVITGHDSRGHAVVDADEVLASASAAPGYDAVRHWVTDAMPARNDVPPADLARPLTDLRIGELAPGHRSPMHRTHTLDYAIVLEGECRLGLDGGEALDLGPGDVVIQRGSNHVWENRGEVPVRLAFVLIEAAPMTVDGERLPDTRPLAPPNLRRDA